MNPFVNPNKRGVSLPSGCKNLIDVLQHHENAHNSTIQRFIHLILFQAQQDGATELVFGVASVSGDTPIRYKIGGAWYDLLPFPSHIRPSAVSELVRIARFHAGRIPGEGVLDERFGEVRLRWIVKITSADGECILEHVEDRNELAT